MNLVGRELLASVERRYCEKDVPGVGTIRCQSLNAKEAAILDASYIEEDGFSPEQYAKRKPLVISLCLVDEAGHRVFSDDEFEDLELVDAAVIDAIYEVCESHINKDTVAAKNLKATSEEGSTSDLPTSAVGSAA